MASEIERNLARNLREARKKVGFKTRAAFSQATGIDEQVIVKTELMKSFPRPETIQKMAEACRLRPFELFLSEKDKKIWSLTSELIKTIKPVSQKK